MRRKELKVRWGAGREGRRKERKEERKELEVRWLMGSG